MRLETSIYNLTYVSKYPQAWMNTSSQDRPPAFRLPTASLKPSIRSEENSSGPRTVGEASTRRRGESVHLDTAAGRWYIKHFFSKYHPISTYLWPKGFQRQLITFSKLIIVTTLILDDLEITGLRCSVDPFVATADDWSLPKPAENWLPGCHPNGRTLRSSWEYSQVSDL